MPFGADDYAIAAGTAAVAQTVGNVLTSSAGNARSEHMQGRQMEYESNQALIAHRRGEESRLGAQNYSTQMSNTQLQRGVADAKAAGLHPSLATGNASSPSSSAVSSGQGNAGVPQTFVPTIHLPDLFAMGVSLKQLEQADKNIAISDKTANANITKALSSSELDKLQVMGKGGIDTLDRGAGHALRSIYKKMQETTRKPRVDYEQMEPGQNMFQLQPQR